MQRPAHLPDYEKPPLAEVVLGVQFDKFRNFTSLHAAEILELFEREFPNYEEHPPLEANYETFGRETPEPRLSVQIGPPILRPRQWFVSEDGSHLFQVQDDRLILNWRKQEDGEYPHFEGVLPIFMKYFMRLNEFSKAKFGAEIKANQCDVTYVNLIPVDRFSDASFFLRSLGEVPEDAEGFNFRISRVISGESGSRRARLRNDIRTVFHGAEQKMGIQFELSVRGKPKGEGMGSVEGFMIAARESIVMEFDRVSTNEARATWQRK